MTTITESSNRWAELADRLEPDGRAFIDGEHVDARDGRTSIVTVTTSSGRNAHTRARRWPAFIEARLAQFGREAASVPPAHRTAAT